jgi:hypothetical protein
MIEVPLCGSNLKALIDDVDGPRVLHIEWRLFNNGKGKLYANYGACLMHALIMQTPDGMATHHVNGNGLDNRRINLRIVTYGENARDLNKKLLKSNTSGAHGVSWMKSRNAWRVRIKVDQEEFHIGLFKSLDRAIEARKKAEKDYW